VRCGPLSTRHRFRPERVAGEVDAHGAAVANWRLIE